MSDLDLARRHSQRTIPLEPKPDPDPLVRLLEETAMGHRVSLFGHCACGEDITANPLAIARHVAADQARALREAGLA